MKITFITGGARSGKSSFALHKASQIEGKKAFVATAEALDDEMKKRIENHKIERGSEWNTHEEPIKIAGGLSDIKDTCNAIVLDCLTIWLSNLLVRNEMAEPFKQTTGESIQEFIDTLRQMHNETLNPKSGKGLFIISNEVGMGIVPENKLARRFRDLAGTLNQKVAEIADEVYLVTAGIPVKIK
jgi:adenosylcobinamide kinase/adenosylcobinamide-phosphate guanylyltransferase